MTTPDEQPEGTEPEPGPPVWVRLNKAPDMSDPFVLEACPDGRKWVYLVAAEAIAESPERPGPGRRLSPADRFTLGLRPQPVDAPSEAGLAVDLGGWSGEGLQSVVQGHTTGQHPTGDEEE